MGYIVKVESSSPINVRHFEEWRDSVPEYKRCPSYVADPDDEGKNASTFGYEIIVAGSWSNSGHLFRSYVERMIRYFRKVHHIHLSANWKYL